MTSFERVIKRWTAAYAGTPNLNQNQTIGVNLLALVFLVMAVLQLVGYSQFRDALTNLGLTSSPETWAVVIIVAEVWAALAFFGIRLHAMLRFFGGLFAVLASGFWFFMTLQAVTSFDSNINNSGFFGKYLTQAPGWWTVIEATVLLFWTIYTLEVTKRN